MDVELEECVPPEILYHGTGEKYTESIDVQGLIPKSRLYVHLSKERETAVNGVWLTKEVPVKYLRKGSALTRKKWR